MRSILVSTNVD